MKRRQRRSERVFFSYFVFYVCPSTTNTILISFSLTLSILYVPKFMLNPEMANKKNIFFLSCYVSIPKSCILCVEGNKKKEKKEGEPSSIHPSSLFYASSVLRIFIFSIKTDIFISLNGVSCFFSSFSLTPLAFKMRFRNFFLLHFAFKLI